MAIFEDLSKTLKTLIYQGLSGITGNVNVQTIDGMIDFLDLTGDIPGKLFLIFNDLSDEVLQFVDCINRLTQPKDVI